MEEPDRPQVTIVRHMRFACWTTKAIDIHSDHAILLFTRIYGSSGCTYTACIIYLLFYSFFAFFGHSVVIKCYTTLKVGMKFDIRVHFGSFFFKLNVHVCRSLNTSTLYTWYPFFSDLVKNWRLLRKEYVGLWTVLIPDMVLVMVPMKL
jgi:hypothetical protein